MKPMTQAEYKKNSSVCPYCKSHNINGDHIEVDGDGAWQTINCDNCGAMWCDLYKLVGYEKVEVDRKNSL